MCIICFIYNLSSFITTENHLTVTFWLTTREKKMIGCIFVIIIVEYCANRYNFANGLMCSSSSTQPWWPYARSSWIRCGVKSKNARIRLPFQKVDKTIKITLIIVTKCTHWSIESWGYQNIETQKKYTSNTQTTVVNCILSGQVTVVRYHNNTHNYNENRSIIIRMKLFQWRSRNYQFAWFSAPNYFALFVSSTIPIWRSVFFLFFFCFFSVSLLLIWCCFYTI